MRGQGSPKPLAMAHIPLSHPIKNDLPLTFEARTVQGTVLCSNLLHHTSSWEGSQNLVRCLYINVQSPRTIPLGFQVTSPMRHSKEVFW